MHPEESKPYRIGLATLVNAASYPSAAGIKVDNMLSVLGSDGQNAVSCLQGGAATFGTATLQREISFDDGATWQADGAAISAATPVAITLYRGAKYRWTVTGTGNITGANLAVV